MTNDCNCSPMLADSGKFEVKKMIETPGLVMFGAGAVATFLVTKFVGKKGKRR